MNRKYEDEDGLDLEATVRDLRALEDESAGELRWRQRVGRSFEKMRVELERVQRHLVAVDERMLDRRTVATIAKTEQAVLANQVKTLERIVWGLTGALAVALVGLAVSKVFK